MKWVGFPPNGGKGGREGRGEVPGEEWIEFLKTNGPVGVRMGGERERSRL